MNEVKEKKYLKKILYLVFSILIIFIFVGILIFKSLNSPKKVEYKSFSLENKSIGMKISFSYNTNDKFKNFKDELNSENDLSVVSFKNSELFFDFDFHYDTMLAETYNKLKGEREKLEYYREYEVDKYKIYISSDGGSYAYGYIYLMDRSIGDTKMAEVLYFSIYNSKQRTKDEFFKALDDDRIANLIKSIKVEKIKKVEKDSKNDNAE